MVILHIITWIRNLLISGITTAFLKPSRRKPSDKKHFTEFVIDRKGYLDNLSQEKVPGMQQTRFVWRFSDNFLCLFFRDMLKSLKTRRLGGSKSLKRVSIENILQILNILSEKKRNKAICQ